MDVLYRRGSATAVQVRQEIADPPSYSGVRALLAVLETKGHVRHESDGPRYVYLPVQDPKKARKAALTHLVSTFFEGSAVAAAAALIESHGNAIGDEELERLSMLIDEAREEGR
jgi:predicted transcriptional regulator